MVAGAKGRERPRRRLADCVKEEMKVENSTEQDALERAKRKGGIHTDDPTYGGGGEKS